jgi:hypothetical protein
MLATKRVVLFLILLSALALLQNLQNVKLLSTDGGAATGKEQALNEFVSTAANTESKQGNNGTDTKLLLPINKLIHLTIFGLGHRLCRATAAWHLTKKLNLTRMKLNWGTCGKTHDTGFPIFPNLFQSEEWDVPNSNFASPQRGKEVLVRNDVYGYVPAQTFKNYHFPLDDETYKDPEGPFLSKMASDVELYRLLEDQFMFKDRLQIFMEQHRFQDHSVLGIHLRAGNGEVTHFTDSGRYIANETEFVSNLVNLVQHFLDSVQTSHPEQFPKTKPPLIFLATDTAKLVPGFVNATQTLFGVPTVVLPQIRVDDNAGVTFQAFQGKGEKCLLGWQAMVSDMLLLSHADVLIAARHSSFTQSLPLSLVMDRHRNQVGPHFCEASANATSMTCLQDLPTWLFRDDETKMWTYSLLDNGNNDEPVQHKSLVFLPDVKPAKEYAHVVNFLQTEDPQQHSVQTHTYGNNRFNPKYRNRKKGNRLTLEWNFTSAN